jgi:hypothetical protein
VSAAATTLQKMDWLSYFTRSEKIFLGMVIAVELLGLAFAVAMVVFRS